MTGRTTGSGAAAPWTPPAVDELARLLPQYEIDEMLGRGGMGAVYKGKQASLGRTVAIKVLPETLAAMAGEEGGDPHQYVERFKLEARSMANLDHPAIISVFDFGQTEAGHLYFVMEFIDGMDIEQYIAASGGTVDPEHAMAIVSHVLDALDYAHSKGIIHRDIKPANVLLNRDGRVKIADFGLAKTLGDAAGEDGDLASSSMMGLTMTDMAMGTPDYIAPETLEDGVTPDHRADLYAVGVMLYKMLTGKLPRGIFQLPSEANPQLDPRFDDMIAQSMASEPASRYQSASEFRAHLGAMLARPPEKIEPGQAMEDVEPPVGKSRLNFPADGASWAVKRNGGGKAETGARKSSGAAIGVVVVVCLVIGAAVYFLVIKKRVGDAGLADEKSGADAEAVSSADPEMDIAGGEDASSAPQVSAASRDQPFENNLGMKFVPVPITGGASDGQRVLFSVWETRVIDFAAFVAEHPGRVWPAEDFAQFDLHPAVVVSWHDAVKFCEWLTEVDRKSGLLASSYRYRLPTDHEWSCAVGIGDSEDPGALPVEKNSKIAGRYPWGRVFPPLELMENIFGEENGHDPSRQPPVNGYNDGFIHTAPVGSFVANEFGIFDLGGNVREWCGNLYSSQDGGRVLRGGSWNTAESKRLRCSRRNSFSSGARGRTYGFRVVLTPGAETD